MKRFISLLCAILLLVTSIGPVNLVTVQAADQEEFVTDNLEGKVVYTGVLQDDGELGIPVGIKTYMANGKDTVTTDETPVMLYVVNTNTTRVGKTSDEEIIQSLLEREYVVIVLDYYNHPLTVCPAIDKSLQSIKMMITWVTSEGVSTTEPGSQTEAPAQEMLRSQWLGSEMTDASQTDLLIPTSQMGIYVLPAGYNVTRQYNYWSIDKHGSMGDFDWIMYAWNTDFLAMAEGKWQNDNYKWSAFKTYITFEEDTKILLGADRDKSLEESYHTFTKGTKMTVMDYTAMLDGGIVTDISQCIKRNGKPIDMNLYMDIIYPDNPDQDVPVLVYAQSGSDTLGTWNSKRERPHATGFLFRGYAVAFNDFPYVPMARDDHYFYFAGNEIEQGSITGKNQTFSLGIYNDVKVHTAAVRCLRYLADSDAKYEFALDKFASLGISKSGNSSARLGNPDPVSLPESTIHKDYDGKTRYEYGETEDYTDTVTGFSIRGGEAQPWLTYQDGREIPSNVQFSSMNVGSSYEAITDGSAPLYIYGTALSGGSQYDSYPEALSIAYSHDLPVMYYDNLPVGHALCWGPDGETGNDSYEALFTTADYWLLGKGAKCEYIKPLNGTTNVSATQKVVVKFNGPVSETEILNKVTITNTTNPSQVVKGVWEPTFGRTEWNFTPSNFEGNATYIVNVPDDIVCENGATLLSGNTVSFTIADETNAGTAANMPENLTATSDAGVFFSIEDVALDISASISLRFTVTNDAANIAEIYSADAEGNVGQLLDSVNIAGAGIYEADVSKYIASLDSGDTAYFVLKAKKAAGETTVYSQDFETAANLKDAIAPMKRSGGVSAQIITDPANSNNKVMAVTGRGVYNDFSAAFKDYMDGDGTTIEGTKGWFLPSKAISYPNFYQGSSSTFTLIPFSEFGEEDYGRRFRVDFTLYDTVSRRINILGNGLADKTAKVIDGTSPRYNRETQEGENNYSMEFDLTGNLYTKRIGVGVNTQAYGRTFTSTQPLYIDNVCYTEIVTNIDVAKTTEVYDAPTLVSRVEYVNSASVYDSTNLADATVVVSSENASITAGTAPAKNTNALYNIAVGDPVLVAKTTSGSGEYAMIKHTVSKDAVEVVVEATMLSWYATAGITVNDNAHVINDPYAGNGQWHKLIVTMTKGDAGWTIKYKNISNEAVEGTETSGGTVEKLTNILVGGKSLESGDDYGTDYGVYIKDIQITETLVKNNTVVTVQNTDGATTFYDTIEEAIEAAETGATVTLNGDYALPQSLQYMKKDVVIDLNGHELTGNSFASFNATVVDNSKDKTGVLKIAKGKLYVPKNEQIPVWTGEGYAFADVMVGASDDDTYLSQISNGEKLAALNAQDTKFIYLITKPELGTELGDNFIGALNTLLADGASQEDIKIGVRLEWESENGSTKNVQYCYYSDELVKQVYAEGVNNKVFSFVTKGLDNYKNITATPLVVSDCGLMMECGTSFAPKTPSSQN